MRKNKEMFLGLIFDRAGSDQKFKLLKEHIRQEDDIEAWWHYLTNMYIVKTRKTIKQLTGEVHEILGNDSFLVVEVSIEKSDGWLPPRAWRWFEKHSKDTVES